MNRHHRLRLEYESSVDFNQWNNKLLRTYWSICWIVSLGAIIIFALLILSNEYSVKFADMSYFEYVMRYIAVPFVLMAANISVATTVMKLLNQKKQHALQAFVCLTCSTIIAATVTFAHYTVSGIFMSFSFTCIISLVYVDHKPIMFASAISLLTYLAIVAFFLLDKAAAGEITHGVEEIITTIAFICSAVAIAVYIHDRKRILISDILEEKRKNKIDSLTNLLNHAAFYESLDEKLIELKNLANHSDPLSIIVWDIDNFKAVNDTYGHTAGDEIILKLVDAICKLTDGKGDAFRYGGEEFAFITRLRAVDAFEIAEAVRLEFEKSGVTVSCGICEYDLDIRMGKREFFASADEALYKAKKSGKNKTVVYV